MLAVVAYVPCLAARAIYGNYKPECPVVYFQEHCSLSVELAGEARCQTEIYALWMYGYDISAMKADLISAIVKNKTERGQYQFHFVPEENSERMTAVASFVINSLRDNNRNWLLSPYVRADQMSPVEFRRAMSPPALSFLIGTVAYYGGEESDFMKRMADSNILWGAARDLNLSTQKNFKEKSSQIRYRTDGYTRRVWKAIKEKTVPGVSGPTTTTARRSSNRPRSPSPRPGPSANPANGTMQFMWDKNTQKIRTRKPRDPNAKATFQIGSTPFV